MKLLVVRHALAEDRVAFAATGATDALRPLTVRGTERFALAAKGIARVAPTLELIASSRLLRAVQTAEAIFAECGADDTALVDELDPSAPPEAVERWLSKREARRACIVGHEPNLGLFVSWLLGAGDGEECVRLGKGSACLVELHGKPSPGAGQLLWLLDEKHLRDLGRVRHRRTGL